MISNIMLIKSVVSSTGSAEPELANSTEKYVLYSMRFCPFAQRARTVLAAKEIPYVSDTSDTGENNFDQLS